MTTSVHVVNFGPEQVRVEAVNPTTKGAIPVSFAPTILYSQQSANFYVHDGQSLLIEEIREEKK